jgi:hypothetical protein
MNPSGTKLLYNYLRIQMASILETVSNADRDG